MDSTKIEFRQRLGLILCPSWILFFVCLRSWLMGKSSFQTILRFLAICCVFCICRDIFVTVPGTKPNLGPDISKKTKYPFTPLCQITTQSRHLRNLIYLCTMCVCLRLGCRYICEVLHLCQLGPGLKFWISARNIYAYPKFQERGFWKKIDLKWSSNIFCQQYTYCFNEPSFESVLLHPSCPLSSYVS